MIPSVGTGPKSNGNPIFLPDLSFHVFNFLLVLLPWVPVVDFFSWEGFEIEDFFFRVCSWDLLKGGRRSRLGQKTLSSDTDLS